VPCDKESVMASPTDFLSYAVSLRIANRAGTDIEYELPDIIRRVTGKEVANWELSRISLAAGANTAVSGIGADLIFIHTGIEVTFALTGSVAWAADLFMTGSSFGTMAATPCPTITITALAAPSPAVDVTVIRVTF
jgi:hypothetical protein